MSDSYGAITTRPRSSARGTEKKEIGKKKKKKRRSGAELRREERREKMHAGSSGGRRRRGRKHAREKRKGCWTTVGDEDATLAETVMLRWTDTDLASAKDPTLDFACLVGENGGSW